MSTLKVNEVRHLSNTGTANLVLESNATTNLQTTSTLGLSVNGTLTVSGVSTFNGNVVVGNASSDTILFTSTVSGSANYSGFTGEIRMYAGNAAGDDPPDGWLYCNGDTMSQTSGNGGTHHNSDGTGNDYQALFNLLKASADWGNTGSLTWGTNTVKTPDFRTRSPVGVHTGAATSITAGLTQRTLGDTAGTETHTMVTAEMPQHNHSATSANSTTGQTLPSHTHDMQSHTHSLQSHTHSLQSHTHGMDHTHYFDMVNEWNNGPTYSVALDAGPAAGNKTTSGASSTSTGGPSNNTSGGPSNNTSAGPSNNTTTSTGLTLTDPQHNHSITVANTGSGNAHTILSPIIAVHYIIKV